MSHQSLGFPIVGEGVDWLVLNKPTGVSVHNDAQDVCHLLRAQLKKGSFEDIFPVHRLDKETSGLLLVALTATRSRELAVQFQERTCEKYYQAIVRGSLPETSNFGTWSFPISDKAEGRKNPQGLAKDRQEARTEFKVLKTSPYFSWLELHLLTGRQHQIRKHSAIARHAIVGDPRYGDPKYNERMAKIYQTSRMFLHASRLQIAIAGKNYNFTTEPPVEYNQLFPEDLAASKKLE